MAIEITYRLECLSEDIPFRGNAMASGDDELDREAEQWIEDQLNRGNEWAWCCARVTATIEFQGHTFEGETYLGCCSYESEADFLRCSGSDMRYEARCALERELREYVARLEAANACLAELQTRDHDKD